MYSEKILENPLPADLVSDGNVHDGGILIAARYHAAGDMNMRLLLTVCTIGLAAIAISPAQASINFSDVEVTTDFGGYSVFSMGSDAYIDSLFFDFFDAAVGDDHAPAYSGDVTVSYTVTADTSMLLSSVDLRLLGELAGSGWIETEVSITDLDQLDLIGSSTLTMDDDLEFPYLATIGLSRLTDMLRISQTFSLDAADAANFNDLASLDLIRHRFAQVPLPEPATLGLLSISLLAITRRRGVRV